jgi:hypothetical protein
MKLCQFLHERQANSSAFKCSRARALDSVEALENARNLFLGYAGARIGHRKLHTVSDYAESHDNATLKREFESV